jgi:hypothetical protein
MSTPSTPGGPGSTETWPAASGTGPTGSEDKKEQAKEVAGTAKDEARQTAATAKDEARNVAETARDEARTVVEGSKQQARGLMDDAKTQVDEQARTQRDRVVGTLRTFGDDLERMANGEQVSGGMTQDLARQVADRAREIGSRMDGREPAELLDEVRSFARRRPGTFLLGAVAAGVVAGRLTRGARDAQQGQQTQTPLYDDVRANQAMGTGPAASTSGPGLAGTAGAPGTATGSPTAGTGYPEAPAAYPAGSAAGEPATTMDQPGVTGAAGTTPEADNPWAGEANRGGAL